jgi:hypothetical protein
MVSRICKCCMILLVACSIANSVGASKGVLHHSPTSPKCRFNSLCAFAIPRPQAFHGLHKKSAITCALQHEDSEECPGGVCKWVPPPSPDVRNRQQEMPSKDASSVSAFKKMKDTRSWLVPIDQMKLRRGELEDFPVQAMSNTPTQIHTQANN